MAYIGNSPGVASQRIVTTFTATASQTTFTPSSGYTVGYLDVYHNGVKLINGDDYTASNGTTFVLASGAASGDVIEAVAYLPRGLSDGYTKAEADARYMDINSVPTPAAVSDAANSSTGYFALPAGTTAQRPGSAATGYTRMNTTTGSVEFYDGTNWIATNLIPTINSISGTIYAGVASTLTLSLTNATDTIDVKYYEGGTLLATDSGVTVTSGSATSTVPSAVYGQTSGDTISISIFNVDGTPSSNSISKTVVGLPTGGTITSFGGYRIHAFTSSSSFVVPAGFTATADYLVVAGGGGNDGYHSGGGGAGGLIDTTVSLSAQSYTITVGAGGASGGSNSEGTSGGNSSAFGSTAIGGGRGLRQGNNADSGNDGGSGGGSSDGNNRAGTGTTGQGYAGGFGTGGGSSPSGISYPTMGGGGAGGVGGADSNTSGGYGGPGLDKSSKYGTTHGESGWFAGGGGGTQLGSSSASYGLGGQGGGGDGGYLNQPSNTPVRTSKSGLSNTGGGGGGYLYEGNGGGNGGSGIVIVRYQL
jgi:hypothetical protein